jgi:hypothetical protein
MDLEPRLVSRYNQLVKSHIKMNDILSPGAKSLLNDNSAFSQTQAAWRFLNNERCTLSELIKPILSSALSQSDHCCHHYSLIAHDWSGLIYKTHQSKKDRYGVHHEKELGYELQASVLLADETGGPIAPVAVNVVTLKEVLSTYRENGSLEETHLEELAKRIDYLEGCGFKKPLVHIVDREGDSAQWMRVLGNRNWLVRCRSNSRVEYQGASQRVDVLAKQLPLTMSREINYKGKKAYQFLGMAPVGITRLSQPKKKVEGKKIRVKGERVECCFVVSQVRDLKGNVLAWWYLLTNIKEVDMGTIALWYYWRWSIESFFKLLKSAGMQLELWQQESGKAVARRLLIACMACVFVWHLAETKGAHAGELRKVLVRLSGRQMKYGVEFTRPALFSGLCSLLTTFELLEHYNVDELKELLRKTIGDALV